MAPTDRGQQPQDLVDASRLIAERLRAGGRLVVHGQRRAAADARHVVVEYLHPVIVGKPALPAVLAPDPNAEATAPADGSARPPFNDVTLGIAYGDSTIDRPVDIALSDRPTSKAAVRINLPADEGEAKHAAVVSYHVLWEMTHAFMQSRGASSAPDSSLESLYPMLYESAAAPFDDQALSSVAAKLVEAAETRERTLAENRSAIERAAEIVAASTSVFTFGNGGSATDAQDLAYALGAKGVALSSDMATVTALANDVSFDVVFARPLATLARPGDAVVGLSTSGGSTNVLAGLRFARSAGIPAVGLAGYGGGEMVDAGLDVLLSVDSSSVHRIQEAQVALYSEVVLRARSI